MCFVGAMYVQIHVTTIQSVYRQCFISGNINLCPASLQYLAQRGQNTLAQYGNSCYEWVNQRSSWTHAESNCRHHGGHLLQINDAQEEAFIQKFMTSHDSQHAIWIGLYDIGHEETFKWTSGFIADF